MIIKLIGWLLFLAFVHALWEIQIESKAGWARHLPTFRVNTFLTKLLIGKEITGYHLYMLLFLITIFHGIFLFRPFSWRTEATVFGLFCWYFIIEDFLWFVLNKHYRLWNFKKGKITWHKRWIFGLPVSYWWGMILGIFLLIIGR